MELFFLDCSKFSIIFFLKKLNFWIIPIIFNIFGKKLGPDLILSTCQS